MNQKMNDLLSDMMVNNFFFRNNSKKISVLEDCLNIKEFLNVSLCGNAIDMSRLGDERENKEATVYHLWDRFWTHSKQKNCFYWDFFQRFRPRLTIIIPGSVDDIQYLAHMNGGYKKHDRSKSKRKVGIFTEFVFFSRKCTDIYCAKLGGCDDSQSIYQFEARYFQYSILDKRIRFCKDYRIKNNNGKEYMIFKFGHISQIVYDDLYGVCEENNRPQQQPWICQHILTSNEILKFLNLDKEPLSVREGFLNAMCIGSNCVSQVFNTNIECKPQTDRIGRMLNNKYRQYAIARQKKFGNLLRYHNGDSSTFGDASVQTGNSLRASRVSVNGSHNNHHFKRYSKQGGKKIKNENKFNFLEMICDKLGLNYGFENGLPDELLILVSKAIKNAILFANKCPNIAETQVYIDEENCSIAYELVLPAEIVNEKDGEYYKFAIPIVEDKHKHSGYKFYKAENILTPKMVMDNVRLNTKNAQFKPGSWIADITDVTKSCYQQDCKFDIKCDQQTPNRKSASVEMSTFGGKIDWQTFYTIGLHINIGDSDRRKNHNNQYNNNPDSNNNNNNNYNNNRNNLYYHNKYHDNKMHNNWNNHSNYNKYNNYHNYNNVDSNPNLYFSQCNGKSSRWKPVL